MRQVTIILLAIIAVSTTALQVHHEAAGQRQISSTAPASAEAEVTALEDWVKMAEATHERIRALFNAGARGGEAENEALARYNMLIARARLADAKGEPRECAKWYKQAVDAAQTGIRATVAAYDAGMVTLVRLTMAQQQLAEARIHESRTRIWALPE